MIDAAVKAGVKRFILVSSILTENPHIVGSIHRTNVAELVVRSLTSDRAKHKILSAVDRTMLFGQPEFEDFAP